MRVLIIGMYDVVGGIESYVYNLVSRLGHNKNYEFDFLSKGCESVGFQKEISESLEETKFYFIPTYREDLVRAIYLLKSIFYENKYDVVYFNSSFSSDILFVIPYLRKYNPSTKIIIHSHSSSTDKRRWQNILFRHLAVYCADKMIACSKKAGEWLFGKNEILKGTVEIVPNGIDVRRFKYSKDGRRKVRKEYGIDEDVLIIGHVGRFIESKNHVFLLKILSSIKSKYYGKVMLMLVGEGSLKNAIANYADELGLSKNIIFAGIKKNTEEFYSAFDCFVMPSLHEGLPIVGIEAQCSGLKCYFSDTMDPEIIITENASLVKLSENNYESCAKSQIMHFKPFIISCR